MVHLFSELHRRHPDVDLVLLPPEEPTGDEPVAGDDVVADAPIRVAAAARQWWSLMVGSRSVVPAARWSYAATPGHVRSVARVNDRRADGPELLARLGEGLEGGGWSVVRPEGGLDRLTAARDDLDVVASWAGGSGALLLTVSSAPLHVGPERATALAGRR